MTRDKWLREQPWSRRPLIRLSHLLMDLDDRLFDAVEKHPRLEKIYNRLPEGREVATKLHGVLCRVVGHKPVIDICRRPAHDYCEWCEVRMPGQAKRD